MNCYYVRTQKVGTKSCTYSKPHILFDKKNGKTAKEQTAELVDKLQKSEAYSYIVVSESLSLKDKIYEWHMDAEKLAEQLVKRAEYERKRQELKAQIAMLEAQVAELDKEWC